MILNIEILIQKYNKQMLIICKNMINNLNLQKIIQIENIKIVIFQKINKRMIMILLKIRQIINLNKKINTKDL